MASAAVINLAQWQYKPCSIILWTVDSTGLLWSPARYTLQASDSILPANHDSVSVSV